MSDEQNPPPLSLRLKPRLGPAEEKIPAPDGLPPGMKPLGLASKPPAPSHLLFKPPALPPAPPSPSETPAPSGIPASSGVAPPPPTVSDPLSRPFEPIASDIPKFQLRANAPPMPPPMGQDQAAPAAPTVRGTGSGTTMPPFPGGSLSRSSMTASPIPHLKAPIAVPPPQAAEAASPTPKSGIPKIAILAALLVVAAAGGFFVWKKFIKAPPPPVAVEKPKPAGTTPAPAAPKIPSPSSPDPHATVPPAQANVAKPTTVAVPAAPVVTPKATPTNVSKPNTPAVNPVSATTVLAPGVSTGTEVEAVAEASAAFRTFVANAKIGGVFQGQPARMFINGRTARAGETIDPTLGIVFDSIDAEKKQVIFKDKNGVTVTRKY